MITPEIREELRRIQAEVTTPHTDALRGTVWASKKLEVRH